MNPIKPHPFTTLCLAILAATAPVSTAGENAAPSSHFVFDDNFEGDIIIHEVRVPKEGEAMYTYYETLGWRGAAGGYAGIQAHPKAHNYIFSIWDHKSHTAPIRAVHTGPGTLTEKFGGEGTGLKSWNFELGWETDTWYTLVSRCWPVGDHTHYGFWVRSGESGNWTHMVTMDVAAKNAYFQGGTDAFIEDWLETGKNPRTTHLRGGWKRKRDGDWHPFASGRYSVNHWDLEPGKRSFNYRTNWNGGVAKDDTGDFYFMTAGGSETKPTTTNPSRHAIPRTAKSPDFPTIKISSAKAGLTTDLKLAIFWEIAPSTLPQFGFAITLYDNPEGKGEPISRSETIAPHLRSVEIPIPADLDLDRASILLTCRDILDNPSHTVRPRTKPAP